MKDNKTIKDVIILNLEDCKKPNLEFDDNVVIGNGKMVYNIDTDKTAFKMSNKRINENGDVYADITPMGDVSFLSEQDDRLVKSLFDNGKITFIPYFDGIVLTHLNIDNKYSNIEKMRTDIKDYYKPLIT